MAKIKCFMILTLALITCVYIADLNTYQQKIEEQEKTIERQKKTIEYQAGALMNKNECSCGWYEDFYYEHAEEVGAFE